MPEVPEKTPQTPKTVEEPPVIVKKSGLRNKLPLLIIILLLVALIPLGGYFLINESSKAKITPVPTNAPVQTLSPTEKPSPTVDKTTKTFTSKKFKDLSFSGYQLKYPSDWTLTEQRDESVPLSTVTFSKQGYTLKIYQAATGGAQCVYEGDMPEGPASDYRNSKFVDLQSFATLRQTESPANGKMAYVYCQKSTTDDSFGQPTSAGHMTASTGVAVADPKILKEIESIVESITLLK